MSDQRSAISDQRLTRFGIGWLLAAGGLLFAALLLRPVFAGTIILNPIALHLGPIAIHWYGLILAAAIGGAYEWSRRRLIACGIDPAAAERIVWWAAVGGILGARLGFVVQNLGFYLDHPIQILAFSQGGLSIHGGVIGGALGVWLASRWQTANRKQQTALLSPLSSQLSFLTLADVIAPTVLAATILGRFGNFLNYELYGYPTSVAWKMFVPLANRLPGYEQFSFFHPTFLYEALLNGLMLGIVLWCERQRFSGVILSNAKDLDSSAKPQNDTHYDLRSTTYDLRPGSVFLLTLALYSVSRFIVEFFRIGNDLALGLSLAQWVSLAVIIVSLVVLTRRRATEYNLIKN